MWQNLLKTCGQFHSIDFIFQGLRSSLHPQRRRLPGILNFFRFPPPPPPIATMPIHLFFWCANFVVDSGAKACATRWPRIWTMMKLGNHVVAGRLLGMPDSFSTTSTIYALVCFTRASTFISFISGPFGMFCCCFFFLYFFGAQCV